MCDDIDVFPGFDDTLDSDGDVCYGFQDTVDADGVPDGCDLCPEFDDALDCDADGTPDGSETDCQPYGVPDECELADRIPGDAACEDYNNNGVPDECDINDDASDTNFNGIPDEREVEPPSPAPAPHDILKNRYISIDPRGATGCNPCAHHIRVTLDSPEVLGVDADQVGTVWRANVPCPQCISIVGPTKPASEPNWAGCPIVHLTGCAIMPPTTHTIATVTAAGDVSDPRLAETQLRPADNKWWGDAVGQFTGVKWTDPSGVTKFDDVNAGLKTFINPDAINATNTSITDIHPNQPPLPPPANRINKLVNIDDVFNFVKAFQGDEYPGPEIDVCPDP